jgi:hypothetical protein
VAVWRSCGLQASARDSDQTLFSARDEFVRNRGNSVVSGADEQQRNAAGSIEDAASTAPEQLEYQTTQVFLITGMPT